MIDKKSIQQLCILLAILVVVMNGGVDGMKDGNDDGEEKSSSASHRGDNRDIYGAAGSGSSVTSQVHGSDQGSSNSVVGVETVAEATASAAAGGSGNTSAAVRVAPHGPLLPNVRRSGVVGNADRIPVVASIPQNSTGYGRLISAAPLGSGPLGGGRNGQERRGRGRHGGNNAGRMREVAAPSYMPFPGDSAAGMYAGMANPNELPAAGGALPGLYNPRFVGILPPPPAGHQTISRGPPHGGEGSGRNGAQFFGHTGYVVSSTEHIHHPARVAIRHPARAAVNHPLLPGGGPGGMYAGGPNAELVHGRPPQNIGMGGIDAPIIHRIMGSSLTWHPAPATHNQPTANSRIYPAPRTPGYSAGTPGLPGRAAYHTRAVELAERAPLAKEGQSSSNAGAGPSTGPGELPDVDFNDYESIHGSAENLHDDAPPHTASDSQNKGDEIEMSDFVSGDSATKNGGKVPTDDDELSKEQKEMMREHFSRRFRVDEERN